ncbi:MAG TPA: hypothetical protein DCZ97_00115 [Syntrophus sp. (in: bacteria)]|nr:MAG: hypothetical protein A2X92_01845 [Syntrophus sp. GWC2_56_31]HBB15459.1 hypothetical protein [Syntrophus sp. (in: bacteria)]
MKRIGKRGEGRWQRIPWDETLDTAAERFKGIDRAEVETSARFPIPITTIQSISDHYPSVSDV